jgi:hypothetical protein
VHPVKNCKKAIFFIHRSRNKSGRPLFLYVPMVFIKQAAAAAGSRFKQAVASEAGSHICGQTHHQAFASSGSIEKWNYKQSRLP